MLIALEVSYGSNKRSYSIGWFVSAILGVLWIGILLVAGSGMFLQNHLGLALSAWLIAVGVIVFEIKGRVRNRIGNMVLLIANMMAASMMVGYASGTTWRVPKFLGFVAQFENLVQPRAMELKSSKTRSSGRYIGHVLFAGAESVLFWDCNTQKTYLLKRNEIDEISESPITSNDASCLPKKPN